MSAILIVEDNEKNMKLARNPDHSVDESRQVTFGMSSLGRVLPISHTYRPRRDSHHRCTAHHSCRKEAL